MNIEPTKPKGILKFNGGNLALLCNDCRVIVKTRNEFTEEERQWSREGVYFPAYYCDTCKPKHDV